MEPQFAGVYLIDVPYCVDREYDYRIPEGMTVSPGSFVNVPFGNGNRNMLAVVVSLKETSETPENRIKPLRAVCTDRMHGGSLTLTGEMLGLCRFMKSQTLCTTGDAIHAMVPAAALSHIIEYYTATGKPLGSGLSTEAIMIFQHVRAAGRLGIDALRTRSDGDVEGALTELTSGGYLTRELDLKDFHARTENVWSPVDPDELRQVLAGTHAAIRRPKSQGQLAAIGKLLASDGPVTERELLSDPTVERTHLAALLKKGLLRRETVLADEFDYSARERTTPPRDPIVLNDEQEAAAGTLRGLLADGQPHAALLEGVTGSGKTCVMLSLIDTVLDAGRGVILLLPEIALTPQSLAIFCSRYGDRVAVLHSGLSAGDRYDTYLRIRSGCADLVIGTRSAVFAPVHDLGLIIIDEEQEHTYKSDQSPHYHARDIARYRCARSGALMLLASATPSVESRQKAEEGVYTLVRLEKRYGNAALPTVTVADMREETRSGSQAPIGHLLAAKLRETYERGEQSVLFLNRRGYNNYLSCAQCGEAVHCPGCSVSMTYHTRRGSYDEGELRCHWCGRRMKVPAACPSCGGEHLIRMGFGTQKVEQELAALLPGARILRMDTDSTGSKAAYDTMLGQFRRHEADVLLGTQMVTKGHDFPDVTLVGVLLADASLYYDDFRASERTFALLTQVIGRAGRRDKPGEAVIQTNNPEHEIITLARDQDYETFFSREIRLRRALTFPPYCDIALLTLTSPNEHEVMLASTRLSELLRTLSHDERFSGLPMIFFGPFEAPVYRVDSKYRMRMIVKCKLTAPARAMFAAVLSEFSRSSPQLPTLSIDFNPTNL